jgi:large subunit ribosomal protein L6e
MPHRPRNRFLVPGIPRFTRSAIYKMKGRYKFTYNSTKPLKDAPPTYIEKPIGGEKNGGTRCIPINKAPRWYSAEDAPKPKVSRKTHKIGKVRDSITPGTILILLAGRYRGKRVVFLKNLRSGLLLVNGPHCVNGVPLRRVNQAYVIATSTKLDLGKTNLRKFHDGYFKRPRPPKVKPTEEEFFEAYKAKKANFPAERKADQKEVDKLVLSAVEKVGDLKYYLRSTFSLSKGQYPHLMKF